MSSQILAKLVVTKTVRDTGEETYCADVYNADGELQSSDTLSDKIRRVEFKFTNDNNVCVAFEIPTRQ